MLTRIIIRFGAVGCSPSAEVKENSVFSIDFSLVHTCVFFFSFFFTVLSLQLLCSLTWIKLGRVQGRVGHFRISHCKNARKWALIMSGNFWSRLALLTCVFGPSEVSRKSDCLPQPLGGPGFHAHCLHAASQAQWQWVYNRGAEMVSLNWMRHAAAFVIIMFKSNYL